MCKVLILPKDIVHEGGAAVEHCLDRRVVTNLVIADTSPAGTYLQAFKPFGFGKPGLIIHTPGCSH